MRRPQKKTKERAGAGYKKQLGQKTTQKNHLTRKRGVTKRGKNTGGKKTHKKSLQRKGKQK